MGVYIKDMEMPSGCASCDFANYLRDGEPYCRRLMRRVPAARRLPDCPIVPVPPHGRLGDLDELVRQFPYLNNFDSGNVTMTMKAIRNRLYTAPTVIPAEEADCHTAAPISDR